MILLSSISVLAFVALVRSAPMDATDYTNVLAFLRRVGYSVRSFPKVNVSTLTCTLLLGFFHLEHF